MAVLKAVSFMESRWEDQDGRPSADGGYGPMNLTDFSAENGTGKGDGSAREAAAARTARLGADLTGLPLNQIKNNPLANVCAGAAVLASHEPEDAGPDWLAVVMRYRGEAFSRQVAATLLSGQSRVTTDGQKVTLGAQTKVRVPAALKHAMKTDCPKRLDCQWLPAPYEKLDPSEPDTTGNYGNHDLADRTGKGGPKLKYIVIHDTEGSYDGSVKLAQDPTYLAWNYTICSSDGHIAQHLDAKDVGWHADNWYVNMHSIGVEHEVKARNGGWYTETVYPNSAKLVKHLAKKYRIGLGPGHIIGHYQVPGILPGSTKGVRWDSGPYWDWEHYFDLLGAPVGGHKPATRLLRPGDVVSVRPGYADNTHTLTQCEEQSPGSGPCDDGAPTNFATLYQAPSLTAPLAKDIGTHPSGGPDGTNQVNDVSARAQASSKLVVAAVQDDWVQVSWAGELAWIHNPAARRVLVKSHGATVTVRTGAISAPVYGRAYPEAGAYPATIPYQKVTPIEYTLKPGQAYAVTDRKVVTDYFQAKTFDGTTPGDRTVVKGEDVYIQINLAHRLFVRSADVKVHR